MQLISNRSAGRNFVMMRSQFYIQFPLQLSHHNKSSMPRPGIRKNTKWPPARHKEQGIQLWNSASTSGLFQETVTRVLITKPLIAGPYGATLLKIYPTIGYNSEQVSSSYLYHNLFTYLPFSSLCPEIVPLQLLYALLPA
jgi:hypothetical protein